MLTAYYAHNVNVTTEEVLTVTRVLNGEYQCDGRLYYMFSLQDVRRLGLVRTEPVSKVIRTAVYQVWFYEPGYGKRRK